MGKFIKGKDGKFAGSVGDGKTRVPTARNFSVGSPIIPEVMPDPNLPELSDLYKKFTNKLNVDADVWKRRGRRAATLAATTAIAIGTLTACVDAEPAADTDPAPTGAVTAEVDDSLVPEVTSFMVKTVDGREIPCVWGQARAGVTPQSAMGGLSCDWSANTPVDSAASINVPPAPTGR